MLPFPPTSPSYWIYIFCLQSFRPLGYLVIYTMWYSCPLGWWGHTSCLQILCTMHRGWSLSWWLLTHGPLVLHTGLSASVVWQPSAEICGVGWILSSTGRFPVCRLCSYSGESRRDKGTVDTQTPCCLNGRQRFSKALVFHCLLVCGFDHAEWHFTLSFFIFWLSNWEFSLFSAKRKWTLQTDHFLCFLWSALESPFPGEGKFVCRKSNCLVRDGPAEWLVRAACPEGVLRKARRHPSGAGGDQPVQGNTCFCLETEHEWIILFEVEVYFRVDYNCVKYIS